MKKLLAEFVGNVKFLANVLILVYFALVLCIVIDANILTYADDFMLVIFICRYGDSWHLSYSEELQIIFRISGKCYTKLLSLVFFRYADHLFCRMVLG